MTAQYIRIRCARVAFMLTALTLPAALFAQSNTGLLPVDSSALVASSLNPSSLNPSVPSPTASTSVPLSGPRLAPAALVAAKRTSPLVPMPTPHDAGANVGPNLALMGVGAAAVVTGLLIGGDGGSAVAIGGAVVGLVGLYRYMR